MSSQNPDTDGNNIPTPEAARQAAEESGSRAAPCYRLLNVDDEIEGLDEFLEDDGKTWTRIDEFHRWTIGNWWNTQYVPMRRILCDNAGGMASTGEDPLAN